MGRFEEEEEKEEEEVVVVASPQSIKLLMSLLLRASLSCVAPQ